MTEGNNKVTVKIYGQEYTFASTMSMSKEKIMRIASYVDETMRDLAAKGAGGSTSALATLAAVNIAGELLSERDAQGDSIREKEQLEKDISHFQQLWEEAKRTHLQSKEDVRIIQEQRDSIQEKHNSKSIDFETLMRSCEEKDAKIIRLETELNNTKNRLQSSAEQHSGNSEQIKELQDQLKETEGNYFELQMQYIQMKGDLERYKNQG